MPSQEPNYPYPLPPETQMAIRFIDNDNIPIIPAYEALHISNYITSVDLPSAIVTDFLPNSGDPGNFRVEVYDPDTEPPVNVIMAVANQPLKTIELRHKFGPWYRSDFFRLVSDEADHAVNEDQTLLCKLGDPIDIKWERVDETGEVQTSIEVGRPKNLDYNGPNLRRHDIRELKLNVVVFSQRGEGTLDGNINATQTTIKAKAETFVIVRPAGTMKIDNELIEYGSIDVDAREFKDCVRGANAAAHVDGTTILLSQRLPVLGKGAIVDRDLRIVDERLAQATIRLAKPVPVDMGGEDEYGRALPGVLLDGISLSDEPEIETYNEDELALIALKDSDHDSIDVFYVETFSIPSPPFHPDGTSYPSSRNSSGYPTYKNFVVIHGNRGDLTLPHEIMHILLDRAHRPNEPDTALFYENQGDLKAKRIGPYPAAAVADVGNDDTYIIRSKAESLP